MPTSPLTVRSFFRDPVAYVRTHGSDAPLVRFAAGPSRFVLVRDPEAIWRVLVTDAGSFSTGKWKRRARRYVAARRMHVATGLEQLDRERERAASLSAAP